MVMKKITLLALISIMCFISVEAQIVQRVKQGSLDFLKETKNLNVVFDYSDLVINGKTEDSLAAKSGEKWKTNWDNDKIEFYERFTGNANAELINKNITLCLGDFPEADYTATVKVLNMINRLDNNYTAEVIFTRMDSTDVLAVVSIDCKRYVREWTLTKTINKMMNEAGAGFAKLIVKKIKS